MERISASLAEISLKDELASAGRGMELWALSAAVSGEAPRSPLAQYAEMRALGAYALPLPELLSRVGRGYVPLPASAGTAMAALGWPDASAPWQSGDLLTVELGADGKLRGRVSVAPFCVPLSALVFLAHTGAEVALVQAGRDGSRVDRAGDAFTVAFEDAPARILMEGAEAVLEWQRLAQSERLALAGLTLGVIDRAWRIALDALCEGKRAGNVLAD
ncbi:MAG TPA: hypothetical protein VKU60_14805, partial [Chloroflexota bacterium]|nr:hypothetical protein [Chloroflexota bacterium]